jgi:hypothetical protein
MEFLELDNFGRAKRAVKVQGYRNEPEIMGDFVSPRI